MFIIILFYLNRGDELKKRIDKYIFISKNILRIKEDSMEVNLRITDSLYRPCPGVELKEIRGEDTLTYKTDDMGGILLTLPVKGYERYSYEIDIPESYRAGIRLSSLVEGRKNVKFIKIKGKEKMVEQGIGVIYDKKDSISAFRILRILKKERQFLTEVLGTEPVSWEILLYRDRVEDEETIYFPADFAYNLCSNDKEALYSVCIHEWAESSLDMIFKIYSNSDMRWAGDGISNFVAYSFLLLEYPEGFLSFNDERYLSRREKVHDLYKWKPATLLDFLIYRITGSKKFILKDAANYRMAPYFWAKLVEDYGSMELIKIFLKRIKNEEITNEKAVKILSEITGFDIRERLKIKEGEVIDNIENYWPILRNTPDSMVFYDLSPVGEKPEPLFVDIYEVSNKEFCRFLNSNIDDRDSISLWIDVDKNPGILRKKNKFIVRRKYKKYPVTGVSWYGASSFARWAGKRLPTEEEWSLIATNGGMSKYPWGDGWDDGYANWNDKGEYDGYKGVAPVDAYKQGRVYSIIGNLLEWVEDWYDQEQNMKVQKGGCYKYGRDENSPDFRAGGEPYLFYDCAGFRCVEGVPDGFYEKLRKNELIKHLK